MTIETTPSSEMFFKFFEGFKRTHFGDHLSGRHQTSNTGRPNVTTEIPVLSGENFHYLASRYRRGSKFGGLLVFNKEILTVRHLVVPTASGIYPEGKGKGNPKIIPRKHTANLERKQGGNFTYYREHKSWRILNLCDAIAARSLTYWRYLYLSACVASDAT